DQGALDDVFQLTHVARPGVGQQHPLRLIAQQRVRPAVHRRQPGQQVLGERQDVSGTLAQRRHRERENVQAKVEVLAETPGGNGFGQIGVGERHQARLNADLAKAVADRKSTRLNSSHVKISYAVFCLKKKKKKKRQI